MNLVQDMIGLARLALRFGEVERITLHADGVRRETDTTHTVMLGWMAPALAWRLGLSGHLDTDRVASYALVHDMLEVYVGDTDTQINWTAAKQAAKEKREREAGQQFLKEYGDAWPWLKWKLLAYEAQHDPESRYVWAVDKILPKLTHIDNEYAQLFQRGVLPFELYEAFQAQRRRVAGRLYEPWFAPVIDEYDAVYNSLLKGYQLAWSRAAVK